jgi:competence protein ComEC
VRFVPWSVPAAAGTVLGAWGAAAGLPSPVAMLTWAAVPALAVRRTGRVWLLLALLLPVGHMRYEQRDARPDPLAPLSGRTVELAGRSDGRLLRLDAVPGGVVALRPVGAAPRGPVRVRGVLRPAEGARNPGGFDLRAWLRRRGGDQVLRVQAVVRLAEGAGARDRARRALTAGLGPEAALLLRALVLGEREDAGELQERFARAGLAHLLALSGLHLGVAAGAVAALLAPLGPLRGLAVAAAAAAFTLWIGPTPGLIRAALMIGAAGLAAALGAGRPSALATLALAATATLLARPDWLFDLAFQLSYGSLLGIVALGLPLARRAAAGRPGWHPRAWLAGGLAVSASASLATLPWVVSAFGEAPPLGPVVNLVALPLAGALVPAGLATALVGAVAPPLGATLSAALAPLAAALLAVAEAGAALPRMAWGEVAPLGRALWVVGLAPWAWTVRSALAPRRAALVNAAALTASLLVPAPGRLPELVALDVGQGDAFLLRFPGRVEVLVDGGGTPFSDYDVARARVLPALRALDVDELELVIASHADSDHAEGLATVLRAVPAAALGYGHPDPERAVWRRLEAVARAEGVPLLALRRGQRLRFGEAELTVLHPGPADRGRGNDASVALRVDWRGRPWALLLGDVSAEVERRLPVPPTPLLVAPHHGSPHSTSPALLRAASPETVVVSVGRNRYGHPAPDVLRRARASGAEVRRTDQEGAIRVSPAW